MRTLFYLCSWLWLVAPALAQQAPVVSAASDWTVLVITPTDTVARGSRGAVATAKRKPTDEAAKAPSAPARPTTLPAERPTAGARPTTSAKANSKAFLETFADNRNGWLTGRRNGFELEIASDNSYSIRDQRSGQSPTRPGRSFIKLPETLNLNRADTFTVSVEMVVPVGVEPAAGLLIGVKDTSNYCQFRLLDKNKVVLYTRVNGAAQPNYMTGKPTPAKVPIDAKRNTLTVRRTGSQLHFYINGREVEDSPHPFRPFKGNGVGFITFANAVKFQYLTVQVGR